MERYLSQRYVALEFDSLPTDYLGDGDEQRSDGQAIKDRLGISIVRLNLTTFKEIISNLRVTVRIEYKANSVLSECVIEIYNFPSKLLSVMYRNNFIRILSDTYTKEAPEITQRSPSIFQGSIVSLKTEDVGTTDTKLIIRCVLSDRIPIRLRYEKDILNAVGRYSFKEIPLYRLLGIILFDIFGFVKANKTTQADTAYDVKPIKISNEYYPSRRFASRGYNELRRQFKAIKLKNYSHTGSRLKLLKYLLETYFSNYENISYFVSNELLSVFYTDIGFKSKYATGQIGRKGSIHRYLHTGIINQKANTIPSYGRIRLYDNSDIDLLSGQQSYQQFIITIPFTYDLEIGDQIYIYDKINEGLYVIFNIEHRLDNYYQTFETDLILTPYNSLAYSPLEAPTNALNTIF